MAMRRAAARSGEWAQHFSNASCCMNLHPLLAELFFFSLGNFMNDSNRTQHKVTHYVTVWYRTGSEVILDFL